MWRWSTATQNMMDANDLAIKTMTVTSGHGDRLEAVCYTHADGFEDQMLLVSMLLCI